MRIGFLFNHDQIHQISHSLPIAVALSQACEGNNPAVEIRVATTTDRVATEAERQLGSQHLPGLSVVRLNITSRLSRLGAVLAGRLIPAAKFLVFRDNLDFFRTLDALIVTERTSLVLKTRYGLTTPLMILADHGAGDRAIGFGPSAALYDHILAAGPKIRDRFVAEAGVAPARISITGYPKFDAAGDRPRPQFFVGSDKPIILYNPHPSPHLSSWYRHGRAVLDFFLNNPDYNLIFAPHIMLFQRRMVATIDKFRVAFPGVLDPKYAEAPNIHIDLGSIASTDMTYTDAADIYLGEASSQVYEFLRTPRPCVFLNSHRLAFEGDQNFAHWKAGPVAETPADLGPALSKARADHAAYYATQQKMLFDYTFDLTHEPSSIRAARAIRRLIGLTP
jgi:hypothetical protein